MEFKGTLFTYNDEHHLSAFQSSLGTSTKTVVFIGGLGDGFNAVPYLKPLENALAQLGWSLTQVQLSSSYNGYGTSNLQKDCHELDLLIHHLKLQRGIQSIVFLGHSTGSQDCYWHNKNGEYNKDINGYILQAPISDREHFTANDPNYLQVLTNAISLRQQGKGHQILPERLFGAPITADRYYSLVAENGDDDVFSTDLSDERIRTLYQEVNRPICWIYSEKDEYYESKEDMSAVMERYQRLCPAIKVTECVPDADHSINNNQAQEYFISVVTNFIKSL
ncbi:hypothetical protein BDB01DRAFT_738314 [Pilobolus umbonatus]|nr:hypothetical protein BDB01DRAFT_738314 [Pilobolus umbonatus]